MNRPPCATVRGYSYHYRHQESICDGCRDAWNAYQRERREARLADAPAPAPRLPAPCGTAGGARRHRKNGERPCDACRAAFNARAKELKQADADRKAASLAAYHASDAGIAAAKRRAWAEWDEAGL